jgi:hypothetical protein
VSITTRQVVGEEISFSDSQRLEASFWLLYHGTCG